MNLKKKLEEIKSQIKPYIPVLIAVSTTCATVAAASAAYVYRKKYLNSIELDFDAWPIVEIHPNLMKAMREEGTVVKVKIVGDTTYVTDGEKFQDEIEES